MPDQNHKRRHFVLTNTSKTQAFTAPSSGGGGSDAPPGRNRTQHGGALKAQLQQLEPIATLAVNMQRDQGLQSDLGLQLQFISIPDIALAFESLNNDPQHIELLSVRVDGNVTTANVFVPEGKLDFFEKRVADYLSERKKSNGDAFDSSALINTIEAIRVAEVSALWTDDVDQLPQNLDERFWWEVWLPVRAQREKVISDLRTIAQLAQFEVAEHQVNFPERTVMWMYGSRRQLQGSVLTLNCVAELRRAKDTAEFFDGMAQTEQQDWVADALSRLHLTSNGETTPRICLLDSGVNRAHPLLAQSLSSEDLHTCRPAWGVADEANHGTGLAGLALFGDMTEVLASTGAIIVDHRLESVKMTRKDGANTGDAHSHAALFGDAVSQPEVSFPDRPRVFATAVTAADYRDKGRPSSWSAMVDKLAADTDSLGEFPRLFVLAAGNTVDVRAWAQYPDSLSTNLIHDPGQAWNAITVGAFTNKTVTEIPGLENIAPDGGLSPYTTTSRTWESAWPLKPDVVMEGGNVGIDVRGPIGVPSLNLLTTNNEHITAALTTSNATSAASALCARMAAQVMAGYPGLRAETVRALVVHSADWTDAMRRQYLPRDRVATKAEIVNLIRHCGWGVPNLDRAMWSATNSLSLVIEDKIYPYQKIKGKPITSRDMNLHALPWPKDALLALQDVKVQLRVTLSYFIEPNPSARGATSKFYYPSHRLRFDMQRPLDASTEAFVARLNAAAEREDDADPIDPKDPNWLLGDRQRHRGSLHQDIWEGTAAELANRGFVAVYPAKGWWRTRPAQERYDLPARYSLIVSIRTEQANVDLYSIIEQQVAIRIASDIAIEI